MKIHNDPNDVRSLLFSARLPGRLNADQAAALLGFQTHDIPVLVKAGLLKPLGGGARNCVKYFSSSVIERLRNDERWLDKASKSVLRRERPSVSDQNNIPIGHQLNNQGLS